MHPHSNHFKDIYAPIELVHTYHNFHLFILFCHYCSTSDSKRNFYYLSLFGLYNYISSLSLIDEWLQIYMDLLLGGLAHVSWWIYSLATWVMYSNFTIFEPPKVIVLGSLSNLSFHGWDKISTICVGVYDNGIDEDFVLEKISNASLDKKRSIKLVWRL